MKTNIDISLQVLIQALELKGFDVLGAQAHMAPLGVGAMVPPQGSTPKQAGVLALIYPEHKTHTINHNAELRLILTRRTDSLRGHSGQISFPGGKRDPDDTSFAQTALRETCEELGICQDTIELLGMLSRIYIPPSNFHVYPQVGYLNQTPEYKPNPLEVAEVFSIPLSALLDEKYKQQEKRTFGESTVMVPYYAFNGHKVWGATAVMLSELEHRLRVVLDMG